MREIKSNCGKNKMTFAASIIFIEIIFSVFWNPCQAGAQNCLITISKGNFLWLRRFNLIISTLSGGPWSSASTWATGTVPSAGDDVVIRNGATVTIDVNTASLHSLTVGQGFSGILQYENITPRTLTVNGDLIISFGGIFQSALSGSVKTHSLIVAGNCINNGTINFNVVAGTGALITFTGSADTNFDCSGATLTNLQSPLGITLNKGTAGAILSFTPGGIFRVIGSNNVGFLSINKGIFKIAGSNSFINPVFDVASYTIPSTGGIWLNNSSSVISGQFGSPLLSGGILRITDGIYNIGNNSGNTLSYSNTPKIIIEGGNLNVAGRICPGTAGVSTVNYTQTGGTVTVVIQGSTSTTLAGFDIGAGGSSFTMSNGVIIVQRSTGNAIDYLNLASTYSVTGGTIQIGNNSTPSVQSIKFNSKVPVYNFTINNTNTPSVKLVTNDLTIINSLNLNGGNLDASSNGRTVIILSNATGAVTRTSGYVSGNLQRAISGTGSVTYTWNVGTIANYTPVDINFNNLTAPGNLICNSINGDHNAINTSSIDPSKTVNNNWILTNNGVSFTSYTATFSYPSSLTDIAADAAKFLVGKFNNPGWTYSFATGTATNTSISIIATSFSGTGSFQIGDCLVPIPIIYHD